MLQVARLAPRLLGESSGLAGAAGLARVEAAGLAAPPPVVASHTATTTMEVVATAATTHRLRRPSSDNSAISFTSAHAHVIQPMREYVAVFLSRCGINVPAAWAAVRPWSGRRSRRAPGR